MAVVKNFTLWYTLIDNTNIKKKKKRERDREREEVPKYSKGNHLWELL